MSHTLPEAQIMGLSDGEEIMMEILNTFNVNMEILFPF